MNEYYHRARIKVLQEQKRKIDREIEQHRNKLASKTNLKGSKDE